MPCHHLQHYYGWRWWHGIFNKVRKENRQSSCFLCHCMLLNKLISFSLPATLMQSKEDSFCAVLRSCSTISRKVMRTGFYVFTISQRIRRLKIWLNIIVYLQTYVIKIKKWHEYISFAFPLIKDCWILLFWIIKF